VGGDWGSTRRACCLFDPSTESWSWADSLHVARGPSTLVLLRDSTVLVLGGYTRSCERYDPVLNRWQLTSSVAFQDTISETCPPACLLPDGTVLCARSRDAWTYAPDQESWMPTDSMKMSEAYGTLTPLPDGALLVGTEGYDSGFLKPSARFFFAKRRWELTPTMSHPRCHHTANVLRDGRVLIAGGENYRGTSINTFNTCEIFDPTRGEWMGAPSMQTSRTEHVSVTLLNGEVLAIGGFFDLGAKADAPELFSPLLNYWSSCDSLPSSISYVTTASRLRNGNVFVAGETGYPLESCAALFVLDTVATGIGKSVEVPQAVSLVVYPNPFNPTTRIEYTISESGNRQQAIGNSAVKLAVYDVLGREVRVLVDAVQAPGNHEVIFDGSGVPSGMYLVRLTAGSLVATQEMILVR